MRDNRYCFKNNPGYTGTLAAVCQHNLIVWVAGADGPQSFVRSFYYGRRPYKHLYMACAHTNHVHPCGNRVGKRACGVRVVGRKFQ